jgi:hypothetical protein
MVCSTLFKDIVAVALPFSQVLSAPHKAAYLSPYIQWSNSSPSSPLHAITLNKQQMDKPHWRNWYVCLQVDRTGDTLRLYVITYAARSGARRIQSFYQ